MGNGIDGDGGRAKRSEAGRKRAMNALRTCARCRRRSIMKRYWLADLQKHARSCRYCGWDTTQ